MWHERFSAAQDEAAPSRMHARIAMMLWGWGLLSNFEWRISMHIQRTCSKQRLELTMRQ